MSHMSNVRVIFFGTSQFAVPALKKLASSNYQIIAVVTQPDKPAGRKQVLSPSPVKIAAQELGLKVLQPTSLQLSPSHGERASLPKTWGGIEGEVDLFVVASYGKIIPKSILEIPKYGTLNIHPSLLPKYRGPSPIQAAILNGDTETGATIMKLDEEMDHGPILASEKLKVESEKFKELHDELAEMGAELLLKILPDYTAGKIKLQPQDHAKATFTKIISKDDGRIDWSRSAEEIDRQIRAYHVWPVACTTLDGKRLKIYEASPSPREERAGVRFGTLHVNPKRELFVECGRSLLEILELQLEGAKKITAREFVNGYRDLGKKALC